MSGNYSPSSLESAFLLAWTALGGPPLEREVVLPETKRRFRWDFCHRSSKTLIDCQGSTWAAGGHSTGAGIRDDSEKSNIATLAGWRAYHLTTDMVRDDPTRYVGPIVAATREATACRD